MRASAGRATTLVVSLLLSISSHSFLLPRRSAPARSPTTKQELRVSLTLATATPRKEGQRRT